MAIYEQSGQMTYIDPIGNQHILYPFTKKECVEGLSSIEASIGNLGKLETSKKSNLVDAINEARNTGGGPSSDIQEAINAALTEAKNNGEFDGRGIVSIIRTGGTGAAGTVDTYTITYTDKTSTTFTVYNGANGSDGGGGGGSGESGEDGATFTPSVDSAGNLSWSNDKGLPNPQSVNIKGDPGKDGVNGVSPTITTNTVDGGNEVIFSDTVGSKSIVIKDGKDGKDGSNGVGILNITQSATSTESGGINVITVTMSNGTTSTFNVKNGLEGTSGKDGVGISDVKQTTSSSASGGTNVVTVELSDGTKRTFSVNNGLAGVDGVGVASITQTTTSTTDGGENVITATLSDGTKTTFNVKNGTKGSSGRDATVNGVNTLTINTGSGIIARQSGSTMTISANYEYSQTDINPGVSILETGKLYFVYE